MVNHQTMAWFIPRPWFCIPGCHTGPHELSRQFHLAPEQFYMLSLGCGIFLSYQRILFWNSAELVSLQDGCWPIRCASQDTQVNNSHLTPWDCISQFGFFFSFFLLIDMKSTTQGTTLRQQGFHEVNKRRTFLQDNSWIKKCPKEEK